MHRQALLVRRWAVAQVLTTRPSRGGAVTAQITISLPTCILPGCTSYTAAEGMPCSGCLEAFGPMLVQRPDAPATAPTEIAQRDAEVREILAARRHPKPGPATELERRQGQTCWLCEERRTCTRMPTGWECDTCRGVA